MRLLKGIGAAWVSVAFCCLMSMCLIEPVYPRVLELADRIVELSVFAALVAGILWAMENEHWRFWKGYVTIGACLGFMGSIVVGSWIYTDLVSSTSLFVGVLSVSLWGALVGAVTAAFYDGLVGPLKGRE
jgi:hypothetical protein